MCSGSITAGRGGSVGVRDEGEREKTWESLPTTTAHKDGDPPIDAKW